MSVLGMAALGLGAGAAKAGIGMGLGMASRKWDDRQQLEQARELMQLQLQGQQQMGKFNQGLALDTWEKTGPEAQRRRLEEAGLNVGLMYGGSGGGGGTTSAPGSVGGQAATGAQSGSMGLGLQLMQQVQQTQAQTDLIKAQTKKTNTETEKIGGVDTQESIARINNLKQTTDNQGVQNQILQAEKEIKNIEANIAGHTQNDIIRTTYQEAEKIQAEALQAKNAGKISEETYQDVIKQTKLTTQVMTMDLMVQKANLDYINANTQLTEKKTSLTEAEIAETKQVTQKYIAEIKRMEAQTGQGWTQLSQDQQKIVIQRTLADFQTSDAAKLKQWTEVMTDVSKAYSDYVKSNAAAADAIIPF